MATKKEKQKTNAELYKEVESQLYSTGVLSTNFRDLILRELSCIAFPTMYTKEKEKVKFSDERYKNLDTELGRSAIISSDFKRYIMGYAQALNNNVHWSKK